MKSLLSALVVVVLVGACDGATAPRSLPSSVDDSRVPPELRAAYFEDAASLALRDLQANGSSEISIPDEATRPYYNALVLVYNATALPARDTVVDVFQIHTRGPTTRSLLLQLLGTEEWVQRLARREIPTGDPDVDALLARYALSVGSVYTMTNGDVLITIGPPQPLNITALAQRFVGIAGVRFAEPNSSIGDGNNISGSIEASRVLLDYSVGYGDCFSGCIGRRFYHFAVHADEIVEYLGASG
ncbi:MAG TPA: hypothetical protein VGU74_14305, partial [Gemmatimonadales bacterium]|nr:hypothetical protein [Gemmatimonadales bacterium]